MHLFYKSCGTPYLFIIESFFIVICFEFRFTKPKITLCKGEKNSREGAKFKNFKSSILKFQKL